MFSSYAMPHRGRSKNCVWRCCSNQVFPFSRCRTAKVGAFASKYTIEDDKCTEDNNQLNNDYVEMDTTIKQNTKAVLIRGKNKNVTFAICDNEEQD